MSHDEKKEASRTFTRKEFLKTVGLGGAALGGLSLLTRPAEAATGQGKEAGSTGPVGAGAYKWDETADVLVLGGGGAGMMAALEAQKAKAKVIILEKMPTMGGDTALSGGVLYAGGTSVQKAEGVLDARTNQPDTQERALADWMKEGKGAVDPELVKAIINMGPGFVDYFVARGVNFTLYQSGEDPVKRGHACGESVLNAKGTGYTDVLNKEVKKAGINVYTNTKALEILRDSRNHIVGVKAQSKDGIKYFGTKTVILATGGTGENREMTMRYNPEAIRWINMGGAFGTGDGITIAEKLNAKFAGFQNKFDPTGFSLVLGIVEGTKSPEQLTVFAYVFTRVAPRAFIFVDYQGKRFINDAMGYHEGINKRVAMSEAGFCWCVFDQTLYDDPGFILFGTNGSKARLAEAVKSGVVRKAETIEALATQLGIDGKALKGTVDTWNTAVAAGKDNEFDRPSTSLKAIEKGPFYAYKMVPGTVTPYIGAHISVDMNSSCQVLDRDGIPIPGLYAAGVGVAGYRLLGRGYPGSGSAIAAGLASGHIAGNAAAAEAKTKSAPVKKTL